MSGRNFTLTWYYCSPTDTPTRVSIAIVISAEMKFDNVTYTCDISWQGGTTVLIHQSCPVPVCYSEVVPATFSVEINVKRKEM